MSRVLSLVAFLSFAACVRGETLWIEAEKPAKANVVRHPWYSDVQRPLLSGGDFISHWDAVKAGEMEYVVKVPKSADVVSVPSVFTRSTSDSSTSMLPKQARPDRA
jgi:hypothetical protein